MVIVLTLESQLEGSSVLLFNSSHVVACESLGAQSILHAFFFDTELPMYMFLASCYVVSSLIVKSLPLLVRPSTVSD